MTLALGRRERRKETMRRTLLDAAMALIADRGIYGLRVEDITERADLGKGAFYNYFDSKDALIAELVHEGLRRLEAEHLAGLEPAGPLPERVRRLALAHTVFFERHPEYLLLFHQARGLVKVRPEAVTPVRQVLKSWLERIARALLSPDEAAEFVPADVLDLAAAVAASVSGYRSFCLVAGIESRPDTPALALAGGVEELVARRRRREGP